MRHRDVLSLGERLEVEAALDEAFAPLRARRSGLSPLRVRAAVRWGRGAPAPARAPAAYGWSGAIARLSELSVAVGMGALIFAAALGPASPPREHPAPYGLVRLDPGAIDLSPRTTPPLEDERYYLRWLRLDRYIPLQDWLDPSIARPVPARRIDLLPAPSNGLPLSRGPF